MLKRIILSLSLVSILITAGCSTAANAQKIEAENPKQVVEAFYEWYLDYIGKPGTENFHNPLSDKAYQDSEFLSQPMIEETDTLIASFENGGYDPFVCAQNFVDNIKVSEPTFTGKDAAVTVSTNFEGHQFEVKLVEIEGSWKINQINCQ